MLTSPSTPGVPHTGDDHLVLSTTRVPKLGLLGHKNCSWGDLSSALISAQLRSGIFRPPRSICWILLLNLRRPRGLVAAADHQQGTLSPPCGLGLIDCLTLPPCRPVADSLPELPRSQRWQSTMTGQLIITQYPTPVTQQGDTA